MTRSLSRAIFVALPVGAAIPLFLLACLAWNWDAQGGLLLIPIAGLYFCTAVVPAIYFFVFSCSRKLDPAIRKNLLGAIVLTFGLSILLFRWTLTLPSPIQRHEDLACYENVLPYQTQVGCHR